MVDRSRHRCGDLRPRARVPRRDDAGDLCGVADSLGHTATAGFVVSVGAPTVAADDAATTLQNVTVTLCPPVAGTATTALADDRGVLSAKVWLPVISSKAGSPDWPEPRDWVRSSPRLSPSSTSVPASRADSRS